MRADGAAVVRLRLGFGAVVSGVRNEEVCSHVWHDREASRMLRTTSSDHVIAHVCS